MNLQFQNRILKLTILLIIILFSVVFLGMNRKNTVYKEYLKDLKEQNNTLKKENELLLTQIHINAQFRKKHYEEKDSVNKIINKLNKTIIDKNKELSKINSKYNNLSLDSLLKIATERYEKDINSTNNLD